MATRVVAFIALFFLFSYALAAKDFDFFYLVLMWPGSYCAQTNAGCCSPVNGEPKADFFVKGLLPYTNDGFSLTKCNKTTFNPNELSDLEEDLNSYWPNIRCPSTKSSNLWKSAWKTYGVCSGLSQHDYFKKSLDLHAEADVLSILKENDIISTGKVKYSLSFVEEAIYKGIGQNFTIRCSTNSDGDYQIYEIYVCVDKTATEIIPCPILPNFTCNPWVLFPTFTNRTLKNANSPTVTNRIKMHVGE